MKKKRNSSEELKILNEKIEELEAELKEKSDHYLTRLAEVENMRKRFERDRERFIELANERIVLSFLEVLDNLDRALSAEGDIRKGVEMISIQFNEILKREGLVEIEVKEFDPSFHHAVSVEKGKDSEVIEIRKGYKLKSKVIRPTLVKLIEKESN